MAFPHVSSDLPVTDMLAERFLNLPCGQLVSNDDIVDIVETLGFLSANAGRISRRLHENSVEPYEYN
jgi:dTDP-4-amino-4,6-dideoxygalactose transaminase